MNTTSNTIQALNELKTKLEQISVANGYNTTPTIKRGWLLHIFKSHMRTPIEFPVVAYRIEQNLPNAVPGLSTVEDSITILLEGAVLTKTPEEQEDAVDTLLNLQKDIRRTLVFDPNTPRLKYSDIAIQDCQFDLPESGEEYAFFSQKILMKVDDQYA